MMSEKKEMMTIFISLAYISLLAFAIQIYRDE